MPISFSTTPLHCGTPAAFLGDRDALFRVPPRPPRMFPDSRSHTLGDLLAGYGDGSPGAVLPPGHDQDLFDDTYSAQNLQNINLDQLPGQAAGQNARQRRRQQRQQQQQQDNQRTQQPPILSNGPNLCFAAASFHLLEFVKVEA